MRRGALRLLLAVSAAGVLVAGCTGPRAVAPVTLTRVEAVAALTAVGSFALDGRAAINFGERGTQASLNWSQQGDDARLRLSGPFGAGAMRVSLEDDVLSIEDGRGTRLSGADAEDALVRQLGFAPPVAALRWWLLGLPAPGATAAEQRDPQGRLTRLQQDGWQVDYLEYRAHDVQQGRLDLPRRLRATREQLDLRLVIDRWSLQH